MFRGLTFFLCYFIFPKPVSMRKNRSPSLVPCVIELKLNTAVLMRFSDRVTTCFMYLCDRHGVSPVTTDCCIIIAASFWGVTKFMTNCGCSDHKLWGSVLPSLGGPSSKHRGPHGQRIWISSLGMITVSCKDGGKFVWGYLHVKLLHCKTW